MTGLVKDAEGHRGAGVRRGWRRVMNTYLLERLASVFTAGRSAYRHLRGLSGRQDCPLALKLPLVNYSLPHHVCT